MGRSSKEIAILEVLEAGDTKTLAQVAKESGLQEVQVMAAAQALEADGLVDIEATTASYARLGPEGLRAQEQGLPERRAQAALQDGPLPMAALAERAGLSQEESKVAVGWLRRKGWATVAAGPDGPLLKATGKAPEGPDERLLATLTATGAPCDDAGVAELAKRGGLVIVEEVTTRTLRLTKKGAKAKGTATATDETQALDTAFIAHYKELDAPARTAIRYRPYAVAASEDPPLGRVHPLTRMIREIRTIFQGLGFREIEGDYVESAFWNMDALFIPQDHPAREMQDTFYLEEPSTLPVDRKILSTIKGVHESGLKTGSKGWGGSFDEAVSRRALLRTHTTNTTVRYLAEAFAQEDADPVHRVFGVGRVFRNETMDATHLPEFHQIEGIVTEPGADFELLIGLAKRFFGAMGFPEVRFRPAYFPYTEPSMEIDVRHHGRWMELGGCGVFRPEVTRPLGVAHPVLAWGFGLERLAMMRLALDDIRRLYLSDVAWLAGSRL